MFASAARSSSPAATVLFVACIVVIVALSMESPGVSKSSRRRLPLSRIGPGMRRPNRANEGLDEVVAGTLKRRSMQLMCVVEHFPPPDEHIFCCHKRAECDCPRRMGVCAEEVEPEPEPPSPHDDSYIYDYDFNNAKFDKNVDCFRC